MKIYSMRLSLDNGRFLRPTKHDEDEVAAMFNPNSGCYESIMDLGVGEKYTDRDNDKWERLV